MSVKKSTWILLRWHFFFNDSATTEIYTLSLHDALPIWPQIYFHPLPWHARWDTGRILLNRMTGGDWPGTLGVRRSILRATGGYEGGVLFENLELGRKELAAGGREGVPVDPFARRRPPVAPHFWSQRVHPA